MKTVSAAKTVTMDASKKKTKVVPATPEELQAEIKMLSEQVVNHPQVQDKSDENVAKKVAEKLNRRLDRFPNPGLL